MTLPSVSAEPEELQRLARAFDAAWLALHGEGAIDPLQRSAARERPGYLIVQIWQSDPSADLGRMAVELFHAGVAHVPVSRTNA